jgi:hypothetical protein
LVWITPGVVADDLAERVQVWFVGHERVESEALMALGEELDRVARTLQPPLPGDADSDIEREKMLVVGLCGPRFIARLESTGKVGFGRGSRELPRAQPPGDRSRPGSSCASSEP